MLTVFAIVQFFLSQEVTGKDTALSRLSARIAQLSELLSLEQTSKVSLEEQLAQLRGEPCGQRRRARPLQGMYEAGSGGNQQGQISELAAKLDTEKQVSLRALAQVEVLNQQIAALRRQLGAIEQALESPRRRTGNRRPRISDLGQRLNLALAQRVQELSRYRSDFFGRLREILGNRPDIRVVGDRFVLQSEVFFDTGQSVLKPEGRAEMDKIAAALLELNRQIPQDIAWVLRVDGHTDVRPISRRPHQLGPFGGARHRGGAVPDRQGHAAAAPRRRGLRRIPADRSRHRRRRLQPQPPHRAEADGAVSKPALKLRDYAAADEDAAIELWRRTWQQAYPDIDFAARVDWWRERWRKELVPQAKIVVAEMDGVLEGFVTVDPKSGYLDQIVVAPEFWGSNVAVDAARRRPSAFRRRCSNCWSTRTTPAPSRSTKRTDFRMRARTSIRCRAVRSTGCAGGRKPSTLHWLDGSAGTNRRTVRRRPLPMGEVSGMRGADSAYGDIASAALVLGLAAELLELGEHRVDVEVVLLLGGGGRFLFDRRRCGGHGGGQQRHAAFLRCRLLLGGALHLEVEVDLRAQAERHRVERSEAAAFQWVRSRIPWMVDLVVPTSRMIWLSLSSGWLRISQRMALGRSWRRDTGV